METLRSYRLHPKKAVEMARAIFLSAAIPGFSRDQFEERVAWGHDLSAEYRRGRETVYLRFDLRRDLVKMRVGGRSPGLLEGSGAQEVDVSVWQPRVEVSWSSTNRTPVEARAAVALYSAVTDLACRLEVELAEVQIAQTRDEERAEHEAEEAAARAAAVHAASNPFGPSATRCGLTGADLVKGSRGTVAQVVVDQTSFTVADGANITCQACQQALREEVAKLARAAARAAKKAGGAR